MTGNPILDALHEAPLDRQTVEDALDDIEAYQRDGEPMSDLLLVALGSPGNYGDVAPWHARTEEYLDDARRHLVRLLEPKPSHGMFVYTPSGASRLAATCLCRGWGYESTGRDESARGDMGASYAAHLKLADENL